MLSRILEILVVTPFGPPCGLATHRRLAIASRLQSPRKGDAGGMHAPLDPQKRIGAQCFFCSRAGSERDFNAQGSVALIGILAR
jgi:hypothetical protein